MNHLRLARFATAAAVLSAATILLIPATPGFALETTSGQVTPIAAISGSGRLAFDSPEPLEARTGVEPAVAGLPDLFIYDVQPVDANGAPLTTIGIGQAVRFRIAVANGGTGSCTDSSIYLEILMDGAVLDGGNVDLTAVGPGTYIFYSTSTPWTATSGPHTVRVTIDLYGEQAEMNEANNVKDQFFTTGSSSGTCDLAIAGAIQACDTSTNPVSSVVVGQEVLFRFQVANIGTDYPNAASVAITATLDGMPMGGGNYNLTGLPPGYYVNFYSDGWIATAGSHTVIVTVDVYNSQVELDESNNSKSSTFSIATTCSISCSASVPATGVAGSLMSFLGSSVLSGCSTNSVSYDWNFGDGSSHGTTKNVSHAYVSAGTYNWTMTATGSDAGPCTVTGVLVVSATCTPPGIATQPQDVTIQPGQKTVLTLGATGTSLAYQWYLGGTGDVARPIALANSPWYTTAPLTATTTYWVRVFNECGSADSRTATVTVNGGGANCTGTPILVAAAAHSPGSGGTLWQTDLSIFNPDVSTVAVWMRFFPRDTDNGVAPCVSVGTISGRSGVAFDDVILSVFGLADASGGVGVYFDYGMPMVASRTYTPATACPSLSNGDYGQSISGRSPIEGLAVGETGTLLQLEENADSRTNLGFQSASPGTSSIEVNLFAQNGALLGTRIFHLSPWSQHQEGQIFRSVTSAEVRNGRAEVHVVSGGPILAYSSVVDNVTGDGSFSEPLD